MAMMDKGLSKGSPCPRDEKRRRNWYKQVSEPEMPGRVGALGGSLVILERMQISSWMRAARERLKLF